MPASDRLYRTDAIILRRSDFGEADRLLTVFTPQHGKLRLLAKGVRKITSRKAGHVELFMLTDMLVARGRTWDIVSQAEVVEAYPPLRTDLQKTGWAYYLAELVDRFTEEHDPNQPLFELLAFTLARLGHTDDPFIVLRYFELHLLGLTGYQPQLHFCLTCETPIQPVENNYFTLSGGGVLCPEHGHALSHAEPIPLPVLKVLRFLQTEPWERVAGLQLTPTTRQQVETLLLDYITFVLERNLKSVAFIKKLRRST
ncbi:MAG: DNA repair protein RecO [Chloroflexi bacterium]|nr:MAG: DNA repair protein RecO [Chloroflexota bacterium]